MDISAFAETRVQVCHSSPVFLIHSTLAKELFFHHQLGDFYVTLHRVPQSPVTPAPSSWPYFLIRSVWWTVSECTHSMFCFADMLLLSVALYPTLLDLWTDDSWGGDFHVHCLVCSSTLPLPRVDTSSFLDVAAECLPLRTAV